MLTFFNRPRWYRQTAMLGIVLAYSWLLWTGGDVIGQSERLTATPMIDMIELITDVTAASPVSVLVSGTLPDPCWSLLPPVQQPQAADTGDRLRITLQAERDPNLMCAQVLEPFQITIPLTLTGLTAGEYTVQVNEASAALTLTDSLLAAAAADGDTTVTEGDAAFVRLPLAGLAVKVAPGWVIEPVFDSYGLLLPDADAYALTFTALPPLDRTFETPEDMAAYLLGLAIDDPRIARADDLPLDSAVTVADVAGQCRVVIIPADPPRLITVARDVCDDDGLLLAPGLNDTLATLQVIDIDDADESEAD